MNVAGKGLIQRDLQVRIIQNAKSVWTLPGKDSMRAKENATSDAFTEDPSEKQASLRSVKW